MKIYVLNKFVIQTEYDELILIPEIHHWFVDNGYSYNLTGEQFVDYYDLYYAIIIEENVLVHLRLAEILL